MVNAFGQEEVGISRRDAKKNAMRDMYANSTETTFLGKKKLTDKNKGRERYMPR